MFDRAYTFTFDEDDLSKDVTVGRIMPGWCKFIKIKVPNFTNAITCTLTVYDSDSDAVYAKAAIAKNAVTLDDTKTFPIKGFVKINVTLSGAAGGTGGTVLLRLSMVE